MSSIKRVVEYHINRLTDKNPETRLKSIKELELIGDVAALDVLQEIYKSDEDVEVRKAAQAAGRSIYLKNNELLGDA